LAPHVLIARPADNQIFLDALQKFFRAEFDDATIKRALRF
jgi:hypothetical protein